MSNVVYKCKVCNKISTSPVRLLPEDESGKPSPDLEKMWKEHTERFPVIITCSKCEDGSIS